MSSCYHPKFFNLPCKLAQKCIDFSSFVEDCMEDLTNYYIRSTKYYNIITMIDSKADAKKKP